MDGYWCSKCDAWKVTDELTLHPETDKELCFSCAEQLEEELKSELDQVEN